MAIINKLAETLKEKDHFLLLGHVNPDGDSLGSLTALKIGLNQLGKEALILLEEEPPANYAFLPLQKGDYQLFEEFSVSKLDWPELNLIALDSGDRERLGPGSEIQEKILINIDHHPGNSQFGVINYLDPEMAAVGMMVYELFRVTGIEINQQIGRALAVAIITDTGSFRYQNTDSRVFSTMSALLKEGIDIYQINRAIYSSYDYRALKLQGLALSTLSLSNNGKIAWLEVKRSYLEETGTDFEDASGLINYTRDIKGVEVGLAFYEIDTREIRVSLRSNNYCPVNEIAIFFNGGGHARAAGCTLALGLEEAEKMVLNKVEQYVRD